MSAASSEVQHLKRCVALLAACIVCNIEKMDPAFRKRFLDTLANAYDANSVPTGKEALMQLELFAWTRDYMKSLDVRPRRPKS